MSTTNYHHGPEVVERSVAAPLMRTASTGIIGIVGTAPGADESVFPLNTPVLLQPSRTQAARLGSAGTLPWIMDGIYDQYAARAILVRVEEGADEAATMANIIGGAVDGRLTGLHALTSARSITGVRPRCLIAPGYTHQRTTGAVLSIPVNAPGNGYTAATVAIAGTGAGATAEAVITDGQISSITVTNPGRNYTGLPTVTIAGDGAGAAASVVLGDLANPVVAEMVGVAERLAGICLIDGPNTTNSAALLARDDWGSDRLYMIDPQVLVSRAGATVAEPSSARFAGVLARTHNELGFWYSISTKPINGILGTARPIDYELMDYTSTANLLNEKSVSTIIRALAEGDTKAGYVTWGNNSLAADAGYRFLTTRIIADVIAESIGLASFSMTDAPVNRDYIDTTVERVRAFLRFLTRKGAILGGDCWFDPERNSAEQIFIGNPVFSYKFTDTRPAERNTFEYAVTLEYVRELWK